MPFQATLVKNEHLSRNPIFRCLLLGKLKERIEFYHVFSFRQGGARCGVWVLYAQGIVKMANFLCTALPCGNRRHCFCRSYPDSTVVRLMRHDRLTWRCDARIVFQRIDSAFQ